MKRIALFCFLFLFSLFFVCGGNNVLAQESPKHECKKGGGQHDGDGGCKTKPLDMDPELAVKIKQGLENTQDELALGRAKSADNEMLEVFLNFKRAGVEPPVSVLRLGKIVYRMVVYAAIVHYFDYLEKYPVISENMLNLSERYFNLFLKDDAGGVVPVDFLNEHKKLSRVLIDFYEIALNKAFEIPDYVEADRAVGYFVTECRKLKEYDPAFEIPEAKIKEFRDRLQGFATSLEQKMFSDQAESVFNSMSYEEKKALFEFMKKRDQSSFTEYEKKLFEKLNRFFGV